MLNLFDLEMRAWEREVEIQKASRGGALPRRGTGEGGPPLAEPPALRSRLGLLLIRVGTRRAA